MEKDKMEKDEFVMPITLNETLIHRLQCYQFHAKEMASATTDKEILREREECRSYAVEIIVSLIGLNPELDLTK